MIQKLSRKYKYFIISETSSKQQIKFKVGFRWVFYGFFSGGFTDQKTHQVFVCICSGVTKHCTGLTDRTGIRSPHRRLKRPLRAWRQMIGRCLRIRVKVSGRFRRRCVIWCQCGWWGRCGVSSHPIFSDVWK